MRRLLVIEDGSEYEEFARHFLAERFTVVAARTGQEALRRAVEEPPDALLVDLRFERTRAGDLFGDVRALAERRFAGDADRALAHLREQQGTLILAALREAGCDAPAIFVHDFPERRLANLRRLYGQVMAVGGFDADAILEALMGAQS